MVTEVRFYYRLYTVDEYTQGINAIFFSTWNLVLP